jgi:hypothetical protein
MNLGKNIVISVTITSFDEHGKVLETETSSVEMPSKDVFEKNLLTRKSCLDMVLYQFFIDIKKILFRSF